MTPREPSSISENSTAERPPGRRTGAPRAGGNPSRGAPLRRGGLARTAVVVLGLVAAGLMVATELTPVVEIHVNTVGCSELSRYAHADCPTGGDRHAFALLLMAVLTAAMAWGAGIGRSRAAALALVFAGLVVLAVALIIDLPALDNRGLIPDAYNDPQLAGTGAGTGFWLELAGGAVATAAGAIALRVRRDALPSPRGKAGAAAESGSS